MEKKIKKLKTFLFPCIENNYKPSILNGRFFSYLALILVFAKFITVFYLICIPQVPFFSDIASGVLFRMTNEERVLSGRDSLRISPQLNEAALMKAEDMVKNDYFSHWSPEGKSPWHWISLAGYDYQYAGENLAIGFFDATEVHRALVNSPTHKENIVSPDYEEMGIAVVEKDFGGRSSFLVVQMFGTPRKTKIVEAVAEEDLVKEKEERREDILAEEVEEDEREEPAVFGDYDTGISIYPAGTIQKGTFGLFHFLLLKYDALIQQIIIISLLFLGFVLLVNVFVRFDVQHPDIVLKGLFFLAIFLFFDYLDQATITRIFFGVPILG